MLVKNWMTAKVITVEEKDSLSEAINTLKRNKIRRMPVLKGTKLVGIVSDRDIKEASPSKATSLDIWELHYLMSKIKVSDIMTKNPTTISGDATIEKAAIIMHDNKIGGLPVVDDSGNLIGILTENDIFSALINITGARIPSHRLSVIIPDEPGSVKDVCDVMRKFAFKCISIITIKEGIPKGQRKAIIRFQLEGTSLDEMLEELKSKYDEYYIVTE